MSSVDEYDDIFGDIIKWKTMEKGLILKYGKGSTIRRRCDEVDFIAVGDMLDQAKSQKVGIETNNWINK